jgi:hypothetical protein
MPRKRKSPYYGESITDAKKPGIHHKYNDLLDRVFGDRRDTFVEWFDTAVLFDGAASRSEKFGPRAKQVRGNLQSLASQLTGTVFGLTEIGSREFSMLVKAAAAHGVHFETYEIVPKLRRLATIAEEAASLVPVKSVGGRTSRPPRLVHLAQEIAEKMKEAGSRPAKTPNGDFVRILCMLVEAVNATWPTSQRLSISLPDLARAALHSEKIRPE